MARLETDVYQSPQWFKRFFAWAMATAAAEYEDAIASRKQSLFQNLQGTVLEIGPGAGVNLRYLKLENTWIGLEPNPYMHPYLRQKAEQLGLTIDLRTHTIGAAGIANDSIDTVISTLVLCSVPNLDATLAEILRVLKPGGTFLFIEHVAAPSGPLLHQIQTGIRPLWTRIGDGCCPDRNIGQTIEQAGFTTVTQDAFDGPVPIAIVKPHIIGVATK
ncbi:MAG: class I SAM-dependent methyltransferase [Thermosynechococcaceae cyanobacterium]